jgi:ABC-type branched-subunit amino acid transport system substrate-binding protein
VPYSNGVKIRHILWVCWRVLRSGQLAAVLLLILLGASPFIYRALPSTRSLKLTKVALLVAFSGQLQARGNDLYAATQLAVEQASADGGGHTLVTVSALDDRAQPQGAADQARGIAADPAIGAVLCCSTSGAEQAAAAVLPARERLLSMLTVTPATAGAEATLARRQFGAGPVVLLSDETVPQDARADALQPRFQSVGDAVVRVPIDFATGSQPDVVAGVVAQRAPALVVLDMDYPAAATMAAALRTAGVTVPLLGDDRLDGAPAAALLGDLGPVWYIAADRAALLRQTPDTFPSAFDRLRGHQPSGRDLLAYLQTRAAVHDGVAPEQVSRLSVVLYQMAPGVYPGRAVATAGDDVP